MTKDAALAGRVSVIAVVILIAGGVASVAGYGASSNSQPGPSPTLITANKYFSSGGAVRPGGRPRLSSIPAVLNMAPANLPPASCYGPCTQNGIWAGWLFCGQTLDTWVDSYGAVHYFCDYNANQPHPTAAYSGVQVSWNLPAVLPTPAPSGSDQCTPGAPSGGYEYLYQWVGLSGDGDASTITTSSLVQAGISETVDCTGYSLNVGFEPWFEAVSKDPTPEACPADSGSPSNIKVGMKVTVSVEVPQNDTAKQTFEVKYEIKVQASNGSTAFQCDEEEKVNVVYIGDSIEMELEVPSAGLIAGGGLSGGSTDPAFGCPANSNGFSLTPAFSEMNMTNFQYESGPPGPYNTFTQGFPSVTNNQELDMSGCDPVTGSVTQIPSPLLGGYFTEDYGASRYENSPYSSCYAAQCYSYTGYFPGSPVSVFAGGNAYVVYLPGTGYSPIPYGASPIAATTTNTALVIKFIAQSETYTTTSATTGTNNCNDTFAPVSLQYLSQGGGFGPPDLSVTAKVCSPVPPGQVYYGIDFQLWYAPSATSEDLGCSQSSCLKLWDTGVLTSPLIRVYGSASATLVTCSPVNVVTGTSTTCKAAVTGSSPTGTVSWSASANGTFSPGNCALSSGSCNVTFAPTFTPAAHFSAVSVFAQYGGDSDNTGSTGTSSLYVITKQYSSTVVDCVYNPTGSLNVCQVSVSQTCTTYGPYTTTCFPFGPPPTGTVTWSSNMTGLSFSPASCTLLPPVLPPGSPYPPPAVASCGIDFTLSPASSASFTITAHYGGDYIYSPSSDTASVTPTTSISSVTSVSCTPSSVAIRTSTICTVTVTGSSPTGNVTWSTTGIWDFSSRACTLSSGSCTVSYTPTVPASPVNITATYGGDSKNSGSSGTFSLLVTSITTTTTSSTTTQLTTSTTSTATTTTASQSTASTASTATRSQSTTRTTTGSIHASSTSTSTPSTTATSSTSQSGGYSIVSLGLSFVGGVAIASVVFVLFIGRRMGWMSSGHGSA